VGASDIILLIGIPGVVLLLATIFGVVLPRMRRARQREMGITLASFSDVTIVAPPRPSRPLTP